MNGRGKVRANFFEYSASWESLLQPDIVAYDKGVITKPGFDLVLGSNTMRELGIVLDFWTKEITLGNIPLSMRDINKLNTRAQMEKSWMMNSSIYQETSKEPQSTLEATKRLLQILDDNYEKALRDVVENNCIYLSVPEQSSLLKPLQDCEEIFDWTLGVWNCELVSLPLQEGAQSYHRWLFLIPKKQLDVTKKEIQRLCNLGVIQWQADSEWALPTFIIPKMDNTIRVVSNFRELNKQIVRKPFPIPKISTVLQELEAFHMPLPLI